MDVREIFPFLDPEQLNPNDVLEILLYVFQQTPGFVDRGHETNNRETAWVVEEQPLMVEITPLEAVQSVVLDEVPPLPLPEPTPAVVVDGSEATAEDTESEEPRRRRRRSSASASPD